MRFEGGESFAYTTNSAGTCSFNLSQTARQIQIRNINAYSDLSNAQVRIDASGTTLWQTFLASGGGNFGHFPGLTIDGTGDTLSCFVNGTASGAISICGVYRWL